MFITLEGIDGCGKTTLAKALEEKLGFTYFSRKTIIDNRTYQSEQMLKVASLMWTKDGGANDNLMSDDYWIHLHALWYTILQDVTGFPALVRTNNVIVDGWYYKFWANLIEQGKNIDYLKGIYANVVQPEFVIFINVDVEKIYEKNKERLSAYELGSHQNQGRLGKETFIKYQSGTQQRLTELSDERWHTVRFDTFDLEKNIQIVTDTLHKGGIINSAQR